MCKDQGFTMLELLIAAAVVAIILGISFISGRQTLQKSEERAAVKSLQQSIWQGATSASARGMVTVLKKNGNNLHIEDENNKILRRFELAPTVKTNLPEGELLRFLPPGEIEEKTYKALPSPLILKTNSETYTLTVSIIGEVKAEVKK